MPLLVALGIWGLVVVFRPGSVGRARTLRLVLLGALAGTTGVMVWGYIAHRYLADFMPLLIIGGAAGLVDVWRRLDGKSQRARRIAVGLIAAAAAFGMYANLAIASEPADRIAWKGERIRDFVRLQDAIGSVTGRTPSDEVKYDATFNRRLPDHPPAGELYLVGYCEGLYYSIGERENNWIAVDRSKAGGQHPLTLRLDEPLSRERIPLVTVDDRNPRRPPSTVYVQGDGNGRIRFGVVDRRIPSRGRWIEFPVGEDVRVNLVADPALHEVEFDIPSIPEDSGHFGWLTADAEQRVHAGPKLCYDITGLKPSDEPST